MARDPDAGGGLGDAAAGILGRHDQFHLARRVEVRLAGELAAIVADAAAQRAQLFHLGAVVVGVEAADDELARADHLRELRAHFERLALERSCRRCRARAR